MKEIRFVDLRTTMHVMPLPAIERTIGKVKRKLDLKFVLRSGIESTFTFILIIFQM